MLMSYPKPVTVRPRHSSEISHLGIFTGISIPIKISQFPKKNLAPPQLSSFQNALGCQNWLKITEILKGFIFKELKQVISYRHSQ